MRIYASAEYLGDLDETMVQAEFFPSKGVRYPVVISQSPIGSRIAVSRVHGYDNIVYPESTIIYRNLADFLKDWTAVQEMEQAHEMA